MYTTEAHYRHIPVRDLDADALLALSKQMKLSLSREDMQAVREYYVEAGREPTDVELEVIAQTWSEHCKHRIFGARIAHTTENGTEVVDGLFKTYIRKPSRGHHRGEAGLRALALSMTTPGSSASTTTRRSA